MTSPVVVKSLITVKRGKRQAVGSQELHRVVPIRRHREDYGEGASTVGKIPGGLIRKKCIRETCFKLIRDLLQNFFKL